MVIEEHKSTAKYGRSKLRFNHLHESDPMRLSIHERRREKRFEEGKKMLEQIMPYFKLDPDGLTNPGD